jgi:hypothetical protein
LAHDLYLVCCPRPVLVTKHSLHGFQFVQPPFTMKWNLNYDKTELEHTISVIVFIGNLFFTISTERILFLACILNVSSCRLTVTRWVSLVEQEVLTLPRHLSSLHVFSEVRVARSLVFCVVFCKSLFVLFSFDHCIVFRSSIYSFFLSLWYLQTFLLVYCQIYNIFVYSSHFKFPLNLCCISTFF